MEDGASGFVLSALITLGMCEGRSCDRMRDMIKSDLDSSEVQFAIDLLMLAGELAFRVKTESAVRSMTKSDNSPVTLADMGIQAVAGALLEEYFPDAVLVAEENSAELRKPENDEALSQITAYLGSFFPRATQEKVCKWIDRGTGQPGDLFWTLDPIDGTKGFIRGGQYATALALIRNGKVEFSALGCPELELSGYPEFGKGVMLLAIKGKGCWAASFAGETHWVKLQVSSCGDITQARILDSFDPGHKNNEKNAFIRNTLGILPEPSAMDSQAKHAVLAAGGAEIFFRTLPKRDPDYREKIWDVAPGAFAIEEAGGCVTDLLGDPIDYSAGKVLARNPGFVATNGKFHAEVLKTVREAVSALSASKENKPE